VEEVQAASKPDWTEVAASLAPGLLRLAMMLKGSAPDAEDLLQTTFERAQRHGDRIATMTSPAAYLRTVMVNAHLKQGRRKQLQTVSITQADGIAGTATAESGDMWLWLAALSKQQRTVLVLRYYEDLPDVEIAQLVGCSQATVRSHASRGLAALRTLLDNQETP
jgi:RNA polymerase sigma-70 factor (sigma-E family)